MKTIQMNYNDLNVEINLRKRITLLRDYSGTGKTFLFNILLSYFQDKEIKAKLFNYLDIDTTLDEFKLGIRGREFILMDCADLYMNKELWSMIEKSDCYFIISIKGISEIRFTDEVDNCLVLFDNDSIRLERFI